VSLNVILPCAGEGTRLGLPYPKEIHKVAEDKSLIDHSFALMEPFAGMIERVTITITKKKTELVSYLSKYKESFNLCFCFFNDSYSELPGSIKSAAGLFLEKNLVLLPDTVLIGRDDYPVLPEMSKMLEKHDLVFGYLEEKGERLKAMGALRISETRGVEKFCEKPAEGIDQYNAFWTTFGFRRDRSGLILDTLAKSYGRQPIEINSVGSVGAFPVKSYVDLGTWKSIKAYLAG
jgi:UTP-glucose-1-phosphate uridylyltransferase